MNPYEQILFDKRGYVSKWPEDKQAVLIISGGLDSIIMAKRLLKDGFTVYPLHIERGQTNFEAERKSIEIFSQLFKAENPDQYKDTYYIKLNIPPKEFKDDLIPYTKEHGHPLRDTMLQMAAVQYAVSLQSQDKIVRTVFCAVMPEDNFPHSNIESIRATNVAVCQNTDDWRWLISSPNIDNFLEKTPIDKPTEIKWASDNNLSVELTVSCNVATKDTDLLNCGSCSSCDRRREAFATASVLDKTEYYSDKKNAD